MASHYTLTTDNDNENNNNSITSEGLFELSDDDIGLLRRGLLLVSSLSPPSATANELAVLLARSAAAVPLCDDSFMLIVPRSGVPAAPPPN